MKLKARVTNIIKYVKKTANLCMSESFENSIDFEVQIVKYTSHEQYCAYARANTSRAVHDSSLICSLSEF